MGDYRLACNCGDGVIEQSTELVLSSLGEEGNNFLMPIYQGLISIITCLQYSLIRGYIAC